MRFVATTTAPLPSAAAPSNRPKATAAGGAYMPGKIHAIREQIIMRPEYNSQQNLPKIKVTVQRS